MFDLTGIDGYTVPMPPDPKRWLTIDGRGRWHQHDSTGGMKNKIHATLGNYRNTAGRTDAWVFEWDAWDRVYRLRLYIPKGVTVQGRQNMLKAIKPSPEYEKPSDG